MFRGRFVHAIDAKGRLSMPASYRAQLQQTKDAPPILTNLQDHLELYPHEDWLEIEERLSQAAASLQPEAQDLQRFMVSGAVEAPIDGQGRILVPPYLRQHAGLEREVAIAGVGRHVELWDRTRFDQHLARTQARLNEIASVVARSRL